MRRALEWERIESTIEACGPQRWDSAVGEYCAGPYLVLPLVDARALVEESIAMRNCAASLIGECQLDGTRLFSVRDRVSGRRLAMIGLTVNASPPWKVLEVKGPANRPAPRSIGKLAEDLAQMYVLGERSVSRAQERKETVQNEPQVRTREDRPAMSRLVCCFPGTFLDGPGPVTREGTAGCLEQ